MLPRKTSKEFIEQATLLHKGRYDYSLVNYISAHTKIIIICKIHGNFEQTPRNHLFGRNLKGQGCSQCMLKEKFETLRFTNEKIDKDLINRPIKRIGDYINIGTNIEWQCLECYHNWFITPNFIRQGGGCPKCKDTKLNNDIIDSRLDPNIKRIDEYINAYTKINWQCLKCNNIWLAKPSEITRANHTKKGKGSGCPDCSRHTNEKIVGQTLNNLNINFEKIIIKSNNRKYYPDFYIPNNKLIIEYNGIQHYKPTCFGNMNVEEARINFIKQELRDSELRNYCNDNKINLLEIDGRKYKGAHLQKFLVNYFKEIV